MAKEPAPAFQYYPRDFLSDPNTAVMTARQIGAYWLLVSYVWTEGRVVHDGSFLASLARLTDDEWREDVAAIARCFTVEVDAGVEYWRHQRLDVERQKQADWREKSSKGGHSARKHHKRVNHPSTTLQPPFNHPSTTLGSSSASSSASSVQESTPQPPKGAVPSTPQKRKPKLKNADTFPLAVAWNENTSTPIPSVSEVSDERARKIRSRMEERPIEQWIEVFRRIERSSFCRGSGGTGWVATFDWVVKNAETSVKILEGKYDDRDAQPATATQHVDTIEDLEAYRKKREALYGRQ